MPSLQNLNPWRGVADLPRGVWILFFVSLINRMGTMVVPFFTIYLTKSLEFSASRAGLMMFVFGAGTLVAAPLSGRLSDRLGPATVMKISLLASGAILFVFPLAKTWTTVMILTPMLAIASEGFRPACMAIIGDLVPEERRKSAFAFLRLAINLGMSIGPAAGGFLATVSFPLIFIADGATSIAAGLFLLFSGLRAQSSGAKEGTHAPWFAFGAARDPTILYFLGSLFVVALVFFQIEGPIALYLVGDLKLSESTFGLMFTINTIIIVFTEIPLNAATAHWPHRVTLAIGAFLTGAGLGALALVESTLGVALTVVIWTVGEMMLLPAAAAYVSDISPPDRRGEYMGLYSMSFGLAFAIGPWMGIHVLATYGGDALWTGCFVFGTIATVLLLRVATAKPPSQPT